MENGDFYGPSNAQLKTSNIGPENIANSKWPQEQVIRILPAWQIHLIITNFCSSKRQKQSCLSSKNHSRDIKHFKDTQNYSRKLHIVTKRVHYKYFLLYNPCADILDMTSDTVLVHWNTSVRRAEKFIRGEKLRIRSNFYRKQRSNISFNLSIAFLPTWLLYAKTWNASKVYISYTHLKWSITYVKEILVTSFWIAYWHNFRRIGDAMVCNNWDNGTDLGNIWRDWNNKVFDRNIPVLSKLDFCPLPSPSSLILLKDVSDGVIPNS